ncbi:COG4948 L-alanine-DL-glutamate epimerase and related enzymes of enolase superfamily [Candidatus Nanopelagicaceae bacterium]
MKIVSAKTFVVGTPAPHDGGAFWVFVKLTTDSGVEGIGEVYAVPFHPAVVEKMINDVVERYVIGTSPFDIEALWRRAYSAGFTQRPDVSMMAILSGIETACWDIMGKETNQPVYNLLGGKVRDRVRTYTYIYPAPGADNSVYSNADISCERAASYIKEGFTALKFDPAGPYSAFDPRQLSLEMLDFTEKFVKQLREAVGNKVDLLFGTHGQMTPAGAIRLAKKLEKYDLLWFEEPTPPDMPEEMARVAAATSIPIATGERLSTKYEFARVLRHNAAAILQPAIGRVGGIMETKKIAAIAETHYAQLAPHLYAGPIEAAANLHVDLSIPNFLIQESIGKMGNFHAKLLKKPLPWENGYFLPTVDPGLGVELNEEVAAANPYTGKGLHLEMHQVPLN